VIDYTTLAGSIKDDAANENIATADIVGGVLTGKTHTTANNSLSVASASTPTSQTYVKGDAEVPSLGIAMTAGDAGDITVKKLIVRLYGDDDGTFDNAGIGDTLANTLVSSVTLYDGNNIVAGPKSLSLVDAANDYYKTTFDNLNLVVTKGGTKTLTAKVKLLNNATATRYLALDVLPSEDITAEDKEANTITAQGNQLNFTATPSPLITILTNGTLSASSEGNPDGANIVAGKTMQLVGKYRFNALREGFTINKLTVMNDAAGAFGTAVSTNAVSNVTLKYPDINGVMQTKSSSLTAGTATLSGLGFYVAKGTDAYVEIYADVSSMAAVGATLSGKTFRLGLQDTGNSITTLEAVGTSSSTTVDTDGELTVSNPSSVNTYIVRKSAPTFAKSSGLSTTLINGENRLYGFTVTADSAGAVSFGRIAFTFSNGAAAGTLDDLKFYRGSSLLSTETNIYGVVGGDLSVGGAGTIAAGASDTIIVSFNAEETVSAGQSQTFYLDGTVAAAAINETASTKIAIGDEASPINGMVTTNNGSNGNDNTGRVYSANADEGIFATATDFRAVVNSDAGTDAPANIVWSDKSADAHTYPTVATGTVTTATGSNDFTNGYLLKLNVLAPHTLTK
jgi:hypothetical protein